MKPVEPAIGIDFGTSTSKMAWYNPKTNQAETIRNAERGEQTPSVVYFGETQTLVGTPALEMLEYEAERERVIVSVKRDLSSTPAFALPEGKVVRPVEIVAEILRKLRHEARDRLFHQEVKRAVITHPASFSPFEQDLLREAALAAGFIEIELLGEPVAAALAYTHMGLQVGNVVLVYDLGGGTFDLAVLAREDDHTFNLALEPDGLQRCGGDDFDEALYTHCDRIAREQLQRPISLNGKRDIYFLQRCRDRKEKLSNAERTMFSALLTPGAVLFRHELERAIFEELISPIVEETLRKTQTLLRRACDEGYEIDTLVLIGGSTSIPLIQTLLSTRLHLKPLQWHNQDVAVALGAAYHAHTVWLPENQYRRALRAAWTEKQIDTATLAQLTVLTNDLALATDQVVALEREVLGEDKSTLHARQELKRYRALLDVVWSAQLLDETKMNVLTTQANTCVLSQDQLYQIKHEVMSRFVETLTAHQQALEQYQRLVTQMWQEKRLDLMKLHQLTTAASKLGLSGQKTDAIERPIMGGTKEEIVAHQAREQYRQEVEIIWQAGGKIDETALTRLRALVETLHLPTDQATASEREIMGEEKEALFALHQALEQYQHEVENAWADKKIDRKKLYYLYTVAVALKLNDEQMDRIERQVLGDIKEAIFAHSPEIVSPQKTQEQTPVQVPPSPKPESLLPSVNFVLKKTFVNLPSPVLALSISPDGKMLAAGNSDHTVKLWDLRTGQSLHVLKKHSNEVCSVAFSPDGNILASSGDDGNVILWNMLTQKVLHIFSVTNGLLKKVPIRSIAFCLDGELLAAGSDDTIKIWRTLSKQQYASLLGHTSSVRCIACSPDGQLLASGSLDTTVRIWNIQTKKLLYTLEGHSDRVDSLAFHPGGQMLVSGSRDKTIKLWDPRSGKLLKATSAFHSPINSITFSPDGQLLVSGHEDHSVRVREPGSGQLLQKLAGHNNRISAVVFSLSGKSLISGSWDSTIKVWRKEG